ncbi:MAG: hypothetical protein IH820_15475 [Bacteroidetes bacterium]|nr:hypothetical protein [Bacteroidota bacterium]
MRERTLLRIVVVLALLLAAFGVAFAAASLRRGSFEVDMATRLVGRVALYFIPFEGRARQYERPKP